MAEIGVGYMPLNRQLFGRSMAEALADLLAQRYATAKALARATGIDPTTAENLRKGHLSVTTLQKVMGAEGRALWDKLGDELFGETFYQFEERRIDAAIREAEHVRSNLVRLRSAREELLAGAGVVEPAGLGQASDEDRGAASRARTGDHRISYSAAQGAGPRDTAKTVAGERRNFARPRGAK